MSTDTHNEKLASFESTSRSSSVSGITLTAPSNANDFSTRYTDNVNSELSKLYDWEVLNNQAEVQSIDDEKVPSGTASPLLPTDQEAGFAPESLLRRGLQVPTRSKLLTSGFAYPDILTSYSVTEDAWNVFTTQVTSYAKLSSSQWHTTIGKGLGTLAVGGLVFGWFGAIPAYLVLRKTRQRREEENLRERLRGEYRGRGSRNLTEEELQEAELPRFIARWNESFFQPRGLLIRVDLPNEADDMGAMDVGTASPAPSTSPQRVTSPAYKSPARRSAEEARQRLRAARKGRVVIMPLGEAPTPTGGMLSATLQKQRSEERQNYESWLYEQKTGMKDIHPNEPKP